MQASVARVSTASVPLVRAVRIDSASRYPAMLPLQNAAILVISRCRVASMTALDSAIEAKTADLVVR